VRQRRARRAEQIDVRPAIPQRSLAASSRLKYWRFTVGSDVIRLFKALDRKVDKLASVFDKTDLAAK
jgi:hypothetical protein